MNFKRLIKRFGFLMMASFTLFCLGSVVTARSETIKMSTTTSTENSGLLDVLLPEFTQDTGIVVKVFSKGTGAAIRDGIDGNVDVIFVHAKEKEERFVAHGYGTRRYEVMHNDFVIVGPESDPAGIGTVESATEALTKIAESEAGFISRGDDSGTNKMELALWESAGITPEGSWYQESGQGMAATLTIASELEAYTLTDRATYLHNLETLDLVILVEGDPVLLNVYHVLIVNPEQWPAVNETGARALADYLVSNETQKMIGEYGLEEFGQPLFFPDADKTDADLGLE